MFFRTVTLTTLSAGFLMAAPALAQSDAEDESVQQKVTRTGVSERVPGAIVQDALSRHREIQGQRLRGQEGDSAGAGAAVTPGNATAGGGLADLITSITGNSGLGSALGSFGNILGTSGALGGGSSGGSSGGGQNSLQDLLDLRDSLAGRPVNNVDASGTESAETGSTNPLAAQTVSNGSGEPEFRTRLLNSWTGAFFTAVTFGVQSQDFVDLLTGFFRPLFTPLAPPSDGGSGNDGNNGDDGSDGDGIEDLDPGSDNGDDDDSLV